MKETTENTTTEENRDAENRVQRFVPLYDFGVCNLFIAEMDGISPVLQMHFFCIHVKCSASLGNPISFLQWQWQ